MIVTKTIKDVRKQIKQWRQQGLTVGLVPTMGALHEGHVSLVKAAVAQCDRVVASIFVNPTQFAADEDLEHYPRNFSEDCRILRENGCHMVFHPEVAEMYPAGFATSVNLTSEITRQLCGKSRTTHFEGVCTVVSKLFLITMPDRAYFGEKDAQQLVIIKQMVRDMNFDIEVIGCPTVRETDGLAKSSRNAYLNTAERKAAQVLYRAIEAVQPVVDADAAPVLECMHRIISSEPLARIDYIEAVDGQTLMPVNKIRQGDLIALAVYIGKTRLIDNFTVKDNPPIKGDVR